jgi:hypothetical protein
MDNINPTNSNTQTNIDKNSEAFSTIPAEENNTKTNKKKSMIVSTIVIILLLLIAIILTFLLNLNKSPDYVVAQMIKKESGLNESGFQSKINFIYKPYFINATLNANGNIGSLNNNINKFSSQIYLSGTILGNPVNLNSKVRIYKGEEYYKIYGTKSQLFRQINNQWIKTPFAPIKNTNTYEYNKNIKNLSSILKNSSIKEIGSTYINNVYTNEYSISINKKYLNSPSLKKFLGSINNYTVDLWISPSNYYLYKVYLKAGTKEGSLSITLILDQFNQNFKVTIPKNAKQNKSLF